MRTLRRVVALVALIGAGCSGDPTGLPGSLVVQVVTTGTDLDQAYAVRMGSSAYPIVGDTQVMTIPRAGPGRVRIALEQVANNCTVDGGATRTALVPRKGQVELRFDVECTATSAVIGVRASITGGLPDSVVTARVGPAAMRDVPWGATIWTEGLPAGDHTVTLAGVAANCTVVGVNSRSVSVTTGGTVRDTAIVTFEVACVQPVGSVRFVTTTTGADLDPDGYTVALHGPGALVLATNDDKTATGIHAGFGTFELSGVAPNCTVGATNPRAATVIAGGTIELRFDVVCRAITAIRVIVQTTGVDLDRDGYRARATGSPVIQVATVGVNATVTLDALPAGTYTVTLDDLAPNCDIVGAATRTVVTTNGSETVSFTVSCDTLGLVAFSTVVGDNEEIHTARADGTGITRLTTNTDTDTDPSWSSTGRIAFVRTVGGNADIWTMREDGSQQTQLTNSPSHDDGPSWSPDGSRIAFASGRDGNMEIYVMNADGSNVVRLTNEAAVDASPEWSPDGTRIAFVRERCTPQCFYEVHTMAADGSGIVRITQGEVDSYPAWSPDGTRIAFGRLRGCYYYYYYDCAVDLMLVGATGGAPTTVLADGGFYTNPAWSPSGTRLLVSAMACSSYLGCGPNMLAVVRPDGSDIVPVLSASPWGASWRPPQR